AVHEQAAVAIRLDVEVAVAREPDHLGGDLPADAAVEQRLAVGCPDLRSLVADERVGEPEPSNPGQRAREGPAGAGDHAPAGGQRPLDGGDVPRIQAELHVEDGAVEVQGQDLVSTAGQLRQASG